MHDYAREDMRHSLERAGLRPGDTVLFYVSLGLLGRPAGVGSQQELNALFLDCCREVLGPGGTLLIPTYSYSLCRGERFDPLRTPTTLGPFPEFFRTQPGVLRSREPILAVSGEGARAAELLADLPPTSYGEGSLYARLIAAGGKICCVGLKMNWATFRHHLEEMAGVPFRYRKYFRGEMVREDGAVEDVLWQYSVRLWSDRAEPDGHPLAEQMVEAGVCARAPLGRGDVYCVPAAAYRDFAAERFRSNPWLSARGPVGDPLEIEEQRDPTPRTAIALGPNTSLEELALRLAPLPRFGASGACADALAALAGQLPLTFRSYPTGGLYAGRLVPERWACRRAELKTLEGEPVFSAADSPLRVVFGSQAFSGVVGLDELRSHLHTHPLLEDAIPFVHSDHRPGWGLCCSQAELRALRQERYAVEIDAGAAYGAMPVGEALLSGQDPSRELVLCSLISGPCQFNEGLSGVLAALAVYRRLSAAAKLSRSVRFLFTPDISGLFAWCGEGTAARRRSVILLNWLGGPAPLRCATPPDEVPEWQGLAQGLKAQMEVVHGQSPAGLPSLRGLGLPALHLFRGEHAATLGLPHSRTLASDLDVASRDALAGVEDAAERLARALAGEGGG